MSLHKLDNLGCVAGLAVLIEFDELCKGEYESLGSLAVSLDVLENRGKNSYLELAHGVKCDGGEVVLDIGVAETLDNAARIALKLVLGEVESGDDFVKYTLSYVLSHTLVVNAALNGIKTGEESVRNERGVSAVENTYLSGAVHLELVTGDNNVKISAGEGELAVEVVLGFNNPEVEEFRGVDHLILVAETEVLTLGITGVYSVNESVGEYVFFLNPIFELVSELPKVCILEHASLEVVTVSVDKLAGKEDESAETELVSLLEQESELSGEGLRGSIGELVLCREYDTGLRGVGNYEAEVGIFCESEVSVEVLIRLNTSGDNVDDVGLNTLNAAAKMSVYAVLLGEHIAQTRLYRLHYYNATVEVAVLVDSVNHPVYEAAQKSAFSKLNYSFGAYSLIEVHNKSSVLCIDFSIT